MSLKRADLSRVSLRLASLVRTDLRRARLAGAILDGADLSGADLSGANLSGTVLAQADLTAASLGGADFRGAFFGKTILHRADLRGADLSRAVFWYTQVANVRLDQVIRLDTVTHAGPSSIGVDTLFLSKGQIPDSFLRGAGVPDSLIAYLPSLVGTPGVSFYSCFLSHSSKDRRFCDRLYADL